MMMRLINRFSSDDDKLTFSAFLYKGGTLGIGASILGSFLFLCFYPGILWVSAELRNVEFVSDILLTDRLGYLLFFLIVYWTLGFIVTILLSMIPGIIGGIGNVFILAILARSRELTLFRGISSGALVGSIVSLIPLYIGANILIGFVINVPSSEEMVQAIVEIMVSGILAAMVAGAWHGWRMTLAILRPPKS